MIKLRLCLGWAAWVAALLTSTSAAWAAETVVLPASWCPNSDPLFANGFETVAAPPSQPSLGSGGAYPGAVTRTVNVSGLGSRSYHLYVPANYTPTQAWPLLLALRGTTSNNAPARDAAAQQIRNNWAGVANAGGFIVIAPVGNAGSLPYSGWGAAGDEQEISADLDDALAHYNIEQSRLYLWGFSAGAHYGHALALNYPDSFAAYGVSAGGLNQYACTDDGMPPPTCAALLASVHPKIPVDIHLGNTDPLYLQHGAGNDPARFQAQGWIMNRNLYYTLFAGGHTYTIAQLGEIWNHLCPFALAP